MEKYNMGSGMGKPGSWEGDFGKSFCYMAFYQDFQNSEILILIARFVYICNIID